MEIIFMMMLRCCQRGGDTFYEASRRSFCSILRSDSIMMSNGEVLPLLTLSSPPPLFDPLSLSLSLYISLLPSRWWFPCSVDLLYIFWIFLCEWIRSALRVYIRVASSAYIYMRSLPTDVTLLHGFEAVLLLKVIMGLRCYLFVYTATLRDNAIILFYYYPARW